MNTLTNTSSNEFASYSMNRKEIMKDPAKIELNSPSNVHQQMNDNKSDCSNNTDESSSSSSPDLMILPEHSGSAEKETEQLEPNDKISTMLGIDGAFDMSDNESDQVIYTFVCLFFKK
ncbi:hypothetical protein RFI_19673 [Reticulomyxa filosa]|uniref:Uncharacterized protein n=1 Tax=Reticulomyxa filosa TaxID=46433 RepID=X6MUI4_RETFI|nr:hypothetical protein RFI_19673 [Reticulomyxa filosa]|eukprot:ETO17648.1 hypothetical protein RFI_19673 [Reticulomyxa filosa]